MQGGDPAAPHYCPVPPLTGSAGPLQPLPLSHPDALVPGVSSQALQVLDSGAFSGFGEAPTHSALPKLLFLDAGWSQGHPGPRDTWPSASLLPTPAKRLVENGTHAGVLVLLHGILRPPHRGSSLSRQAALECSPEAEVSSWSHSPGAAPPCPAGPHREEGAQGSNQTQTEAAPVPVTLLCPCPWCVLSERWNQRCPRRFASFPWKIHSLCCGKEIKWRNIPDFYGPQPSSPQKHLGEVTACGDGVVGPNQEGAPRK